MVFGLVYPWVPNSTSPLVSLAAATAFGPILTVYAHIDIVHGRVSVLGPDIANVASLILGADVAQHQAAAVVVRVGGNRLL